ncbi:UbiD family decarboxylase [Schlesneria paludicola]|uniref:UbiD family decarboxylase n=1 Tax=Schlesneria paludicola TaxID=360056 RepID=UPI00029A4A9F|nr:UbiD family decarboxylase [Schlesneria paludicola]
MGYRSLAQTVTDLERHGHLVRIDTEIDPCLEAAEIQRRVYLAGGPALLFTRVKGCPFPMVSNLFGTIERTRFMFRDSLEAVRHLVELKIDPTQILKRPLRYLDLPQSLWTMWLRRTRTGPVIEHETTIDQLPQLKSWPNDGGGFITLPQVYTEHPDHPGFKNSNLGMYRVQLGGNDYIPNREIGLHYQIHRSIGVHHAAAVRRGEKLKVNIFVGGPPAMTLSAVMPLPEGLSELLFAAALGRRPVRMISRPGTLPIYADADFCITGTIDPQRTKLEGPFGDHLGYYSLQHQFPVMEVEHVYHRKGAIWPFTVVGRPPQEDTSFGEIIHEITGPIIPTVLPGVKAVHAVDAAGVHPLLLAIGSERYVPYATTRTPQELLTTANAILGQGQLSLAKYLLIVAQEDQPDLDIHDIAAYFRHLLERVDWTQDLHFQTRTTIDTLDYSGSGFNQGSKVVIAAAGPKRRELGTELPPDLTLPDGLRNPRIALPGVIVCECDTSFSNTDHARFTASLPQFPLIVVVDDSQFASTSLNNWLWVTFTRSNPAADISGIEAFTHEKHWGCRGSLIIDARRKPHHAPPLIEDPAVTKRVDQLAAPGGPLHGIF